jgi:5-methyltetrahydropteroyltriglutamate--homocysteine methyltransferase
VGAIDVANDAVESPAEVAATIRAAMKHVDAERILPCTNCGMAPMGRDVAYAKLKALVEGTKIVRREL